MIEVGATAKIDLRDVPMVIKQQIMSMFTYKKKYQDEPFLNYEYKDKVITLPPCMKKLKIVGSLLGDDVVPEEGSWAELSDPFVLQDGFTFRPHQVGAAQELLNDVLTNKFSTLRADCGSGKSWLLSYIAGNLGCKVLILVDQANLMDNFADALKVIWGRDLQRITAKTKTFSDIAVTTFQLLARDDNELASKLSAEYGATLVDEAHVIKATSMKKVLSQLHSKYRLATSATFWSKGLDVGVLEDWLSPVSVDMVDESALLCDVFTIKTGSLWASEDPMEYTTSILPTLATDPVRNVRIMAAIRRCLELKRKVLVVCISKAQAEEFNGLVDLMGYNSRTYVGATSQKVDRALRSDFASGGLDIVFTVKKAVKGLDLPSLDAAILCRPHNNKMECQQTAGRVRRSLEDKPTPMLVEFKDEGGLADTFFRNRVKWYKEFGFVIKN